ncbi:MAG: single-stranded DNA-binding protein [Oscillospiraceae bacterium]|nr:single-stranded DNA-binding protein [Oscillospiraceae bacterium]
MLNHVVIMGRLTRDPELRHTQSNIPVCTFNVAVERDYQSGDRKAVDFIDCVAWRQTGEFVNNYFRRGACIVVSGSLESRKWQDRDGNNRISWEINAFKVWFGESRRDAEERNAERRGSRGYGDPNVYAGPSPLTEMPPGTGDDLPFDTRGSQTSLDDEDGDIPF